jgi:SagB-type dehydrogenase family enzyme
MAFLIFPPPKDARKSSPAVASTAVLQPFAGIPNELSAEEIRYDLLLGIHASSVLPDPAGPLPRIPRDHSAGSDTLRPQVPGPLRDAALGSIVRRRRSALDFDALTPPMGREDLEQLLDFATRDWGADWRGNFAGEAASGESRADFVTLYVYVHRVRDCPPGVYLWDRANRKLEELHAANVQRVAAFLSLEQPLAGNSCFTVSMIADLGGASRIFGNRGYRYVYFEAGATGQRFYLGAETLGWNATGIGAFYDDDVHRYLGFLEDGQDSIDASVREAERASLVMLGSPASRAAARDRSLLSESGEEQPAEGDVIPRKKNEASEINDARQNPRELPRQVIYLFAVGRAVPDPRIED